MCFDDRCNNEHLFPHNFTSIPLEQYLFKSVKRLTGFSFDFGVKRKFGTPKQKIRHFRFVRAIDIASLYGISDVGQHVSHFVPKKNRIQIGPRPKRQNRTVKPCRNDFGTTEKAENISPFAPWQTICALSAKRILLNTQAQA